MTRTVIYCVIWPIIIIAGIFGNVLSIIVIRKTETSSTSSKFLTSLAVADTMNLIVKGAQMVFTWGEMFWPYQYLTWKLSTLSVILLSFLPERISKCITVAIVCDRVVSLTAPLRYKIICRPMRITTIIVMIFVGIASTSLPTIVDVFIYHFTELENRTINTNIRKEYSVSQNSQTTLKIMHEAVNFLLFDCMPIPIVFVGNIIIILSIRKRNILASTTSEVQQQRKHQERQLTKLLLTISMIFFVLTCPSAVYRVLIAARMTPPKTTIATLVGNMNQTLSLTNSAINFVAYAVMNTKYREGFVAIMCRCRRTNGIEDNTEMKHAAQLQS